MRLALYLIAGALLVWASAAHPHSWYSDACCNETDCHPVEYDTVEELPKGEWIYHPLKLKFTKAQVKMSQDKKFHVCYAKNEYSAGYTPRCIYTLSGS